MSDYELRGLWDDLRRLPRDEAVHWLEEAITRDGRPLHRGQGSGTPEEAIARWRELLFRCRTDRTWYAARLAIVPPGGP
jgi:hypothetical protein